MIAEAERQAAQVKTIVPAFNDLTLSRTVQTRSCHLASTGPHPSTLEASSFTVRMIAHLVWKKAWLNLGMKTPPPIATQTAICEGTNTT